MKKTNHILITGTQNHEKGEMKWKEIAKNASTTWKTNREFSDAKAGSANSRNQIKTIEKLTPDVAPESENADI